MRNGAATLPYRRSATVTDEELAKEAQVGDDRALEELVRRNRALLKIRSARYWFPGASREDVHQEALIGLYKAIKTFDSDKGSFRQFLDLCVRAELATALKRHSSSRHVVLNSASRIEGTPEGSESMAAALATARDPFDSVTAADALQRLMACLAEELSALETRALLMHLSGMTYDEIADELGRRTKNIDNALQRARKKIRSVLADASDSQVPLPA